MANVMQMKGRSYWYAYWYKDGKKEVKNTQIKIDGSSNKAREKSKRAAQLVADNMEHVAKGHCTIDAALDAIRAVGVANGMCKAVPSVVELLDSVPRDSRKSSENNRSRSHNLFIVFLGKRAAERADMVTEDECRAFVRGQLERVSSRTVEIYRTYLNMAFRFGIRTQGLTSNPWEGICVNKIAKAAGVNTKPQKREPFSVEEIKIILNQFPQPWRDMAAVSYYCHGLRISDVSMMRWSYVDFERGRIFIPAEKKTDKDRSFLLDGTLRSIMERKKQCACPDDEYIFPSMAERYRHSPGYLSTQFTDLLRAFGILGEDDGRHAAGNKHRMSKKSFHSIRHTTVSGHRTDANLTPDDCRALVGHDSEKVERSYFHLSEEKERYALRRLEDAVR